VGVEGSTGLDSLRKILLPRSRIRLHLLDFQSVITSLY